MRANGSLRASLVGGLHEGFAPAKAPFPLAVYNLVTAPYEDLWGSRLIVALMDVFAFSKNPVDANTIDQLILNTLDGAVLTVDGQTSLICRRVTDLPGGTELDSEGNKIYQIGGSYEIWTDQPL
jgi:hypothetical protein